MTHELDYCPFCGNDEVQIVLDKTTHLGVGAYAKCMHCAAQGGTFIEETVEDAVDSVLRDWNQNDLRPSTICHKIKKFLTQAEYDIHCYWYKIKRWDFKK